MLKVLVYKIGYLLKWPLLILQGRRVKSVKVVITRGNRLLMIRHTYGSQRWSFPGGGVKSGENTVAAAHREIREELGINLVKMEFLGVCEPPQKLRRDQISVYRAEAVHGRLVLQRSEIKEARWVGPNLLPKRLSPTARVVLRLYESVPKQP